MLLAAVRDRPRAAILSSFGKESLCLLALAAEAAINVDVAYFELGVIESAHHFARRFIARRLRHVTLLSPHRTSCAFGEGGVAMSYHFALRSGDEFQILGATFDDGASKAPACGLNAGLVRQGNHQAYDWDLIIAGRRKSDIDDTVGVLAQDSACSTLNHGTTICLPLHDWSDKDVAYYLSIRPGFEPDPQRYELSGERLVNRPQCQSNPDYAAMCIRCLAAPAGRAPVCPTDNPLVTGWAGVEDREHFVSGNVSPAVML